MSLKVPASDLALAEAACARILAKLCILSDVTPLTLKHGPEARPGKPRTKKDDAHVPQRIAKRKPTKGSKLPAGVSGKTKPGKIGAPSKLSSLHAHYRWRMVNAQQKEDITLLFALAAMARRDYEEVTHKDASHDPKDPEGKRAKEKVRRFETEEGAVDWLLSEFHGCSCEEAAAWMVTPGETMKEARRWVRRRRIEHERNPDDGTMSDTNPFHVKVIRMAAKGASRRAIAAEVEITPRQVQTILDQ